jgi:hypothetical protein
MSLRLTARLTSDNKAGVSFGDPYKRFGHFGQAGFTWLVSSHCSSMSLMY